MKKRFYQRKKNDLPNPKKRRATEDVESSGLNDAEDSSAQNHQGKRVRWDGDVQMSEKNSLVTEEDSEDLGSDKVILIFLSSRRFTG